MASLFWKFPKASLVVRGTNLSAPSTQLCLWHFIKLLLTKGFYWKVETVFALQLLNLALTLANSHISLVQLLYTRILRGKKPFGGLCDMKVDCVYNPLKCDLWLLCVHLVVETFGATSSIIILRLWQDHSMTPASYWPSSHFVFFYADSVGKNHNRSIAESPGMVSLSSQ